MERGKGKRITRRPMDDIRGSKGADVATNSFDQLLLQLRAVLCILHEGHIGIDALPLHWVLIPAHAPRTRMQSFAITQEPHKPVCTKDT